MNKLYLVVLFLFAAFNVNAQKYPSIQDLKSNFENVHDYIQQDITFIRNVTEEKLDSEQIKNLEAIFYNKYKYISGSSDLNQLEEQVNATNERLITLLGPKAIKKLSEKENAFVILTGRIYLNENVLEN